MKKLALALATTAALGFAAPALAADTDMSATKAQTQAPANLARQSHLGAFRPPPFCDVHSPALESTVRKLRQ